MTIPRGELEAVVREGLVPDIFRLERARSILEVTEKRSSEINNGCGNFGELFGAIQVALTVEAIMAIARIFDAPNKKYPTRCVRGVLNYLRTHAKDLPEIREPFQLGLALRSMKAPHELERCVTEYPERFATEFATHIELMLKQQYWQDNLVNLKDLRDKGLAHNEHGVKIEGPSWLAITDFTEMCKQIVGVLGWAYFSTAWVINGEYILTSDACAPSRALNRLLDHLYQ